MHIITFNYLITPWESISFYFITNAHIRGNAAESYTTIIRIPYILCKVTRVIIIMGIVCIRMYVSIPTYILLKKTKIIIPVGRFPVTLIARLYSQWNNGEFYTVTGRQVRQDNVMTINRRISRTCKLYISFSLQVPIYTILIYYSWVDIIWLYIL